MDTGLPRLPISTGLMCLYNLLDHGQIIELARAVHSSFYDCLLAGVLITSLITVARALLIWCMPIIVHSWTAAHFYIRCDNWGDGFSHRAYGPPGS